MWLPFALLAVSVVGPFPQPWRVPHQFDAWEAIGYRHKVAELCRTHINNHRARATDRVWHMNKAYYKESDYDTSTSTDVCGRWEWVNTYAAETPNGLPISRFHYLDPSGCYLSERSGERNPPEYVSWEPLWAQRDSHSHPTVFRAFVATQQIYQPMTSEKLVSHEDAVFDGRPALRLVTHSWRKSIVHIDKSTYQLLAVECDERYGKEMTRVTYRDAGGKRYPTRYFTTVSEPDGASRLVHDLEITEYVPHVPGAAELDVEKRFGVTLPDFSPPPDDPNAPPVRVPPKGFTPPSNPSPNAVNPDFSLRRAVIFGVAVAILAVVSYPLWKRRRRMNPERM